MVASRCRLWRVTVRRACGLQAFIRHGDRTPFSAGTCWSGQQDDPVWACPLSQLQRNNVAPRNSTSTGTGRMYDLEWDPRREALRGNCGLVQLTSIGAAQQHGNGEVGGCVLRL